jgi:predicted metal-dependent peptidase
VAIDTSMSMSLPELAEVARQLKALSEHATLTVAECDTRVARVYPWAGVLEDVMGRGGTDLRPIFDDPSSPLSESRASCTSPTAMAPRPRRRHSFPCCGS